MLLSRHCIGGTPFMADAGGDGLREFVTGFRPESTWHSARITGRGYLEYIDRRGV